MLPNPLTSRIPNTKNTTNINNTTRTPVTTSRNLVPSKQDITNKTNLKITVQKLGELNFTKINESTYAKIESYTDKNTGKEVNYYREIYTIRPNGTIETYTENKVYNNRPKPRTIIAYDDKGNKTKAETYKYHAKKPKKPDAYKVTKPDGTTIIVRGKEWAEKLQEEYNIQGQVEVNKTNQKLQIITEYINQLREQGQNTKADQIIQESGLGEYITTKEPTKTTTKTPNIYDYENKQSIWNPEEKNESQQRSDIRTNNNYDGLFSETIPKEPTNIKEAGGTAFKTFTEDLRIATWTATAYKKALENKAIDDKELKKQGLTNKKTTQEYYQEELTKKYNEYVNKEPTKAGQIIINISAYANAERYAEQEIEGKYGKEWRTSENYKEILQEKNKLRTQIYEQEKTDATNYRKDYWKGLAEASTSPIGEQRSISGSIAASAIAIAPIISLGAPIISEIAGYGIAGTQAYRGFKDGWTYENKANLALATIPVSKQFLKRSNQAYTIGEGIITKDYYKKWELDPTEKYSFTQREKVINPETPLRLKGEEIPNLKKVKWIGKEPNEIVLPERNNFEKRLKSYLQREEDAVLTGSRSFYEQAIREKPYSVRKDADIKFTKQKVLIEEAEKINREIFNNKGKIKVIETDIGDVYSISRNGDTIEIGYEVVPSIRTSEGIKLSEINYEIEKKWSTSTEPAKTTKRGREKDLPKFEEAIEMFDHEGELGKPLFKEDIFYHSGEIPTLEEGSISGKVKTPSKFERAYGEQTFPLLYGGMNEFISFFRKGGMDVVKIGTEGTGVKVLRKADLPKEFQTPAKTYNEAVTQANKYLKWLMKNHEGDIAPSAHTITGRDYLGQFGEVEREWIIAGKIKNLKWTGVGIDYFYKKTQNSPIVKITSNQGLQNKSLIKRFINNIKSLSEDLKVQQKTYNEVKENLFKKVKENKKLQPKEAELLKEIEAYEKEVSKQRIQETRRQEEVYKSRDTKTRKTTYKARDNNYNNYNDYATQYDQPYTTYSQATPYNPYEPIRQDGTYYNPTPYRDYTTYEPPTTRTTYYPPPEEPKKKGRLFIPEPNKKKKLVYRPVFKDQGREIIGEKYASYKEANAAGMYITDNTRIKQYKIITEQADDKEPIKKFTKTTKEYKFKPKGTWKQEKRYHQYDTTGEKTKNFNIMKYIKVT